MAGQLLVVGAALVDFIGHYRTDGADIRNHAGNVRITVGGAAFNIATNIAVRNAAKCCLFSYCPTGSVSAQIIRSVCEAIELGNKWIPGTGTSTDEPAYVALLCDEKLDRGVTSSPIEHAALFDTGELEAAVKRCNMVAIETNLNGDQIRILNRLAHRYNKPVCCMVVSDAKATRITGHGFSKPFDLVSLNADEAAAIGFNIYDPPNAQSTGICDIVNAKTVIVTDGERGFIVFKMGFAPQQVPALENLTRVNELGAGDALFAAACLSLMKGEEIGSQESNNRIATWTADVLRVEGANLVREKLEPTGKPDGMVLHGWIALLFAITVLTSAMTVGTTNATTFWIGFFVSCLAGGMLGGNIRAIFAKILGRKAEPDRLTVFLGTAIGFFAALLNASPNVVSGDLPFASANHAAGLNWITVGAFISSFIASLAFEAMLTQIGASQPRAGD